MCRIRRIFKKNEYFPKLEFKLLNKIELSSDNVIITITNNNDDNTKEIKKYLVTNDSEMENKLDKILEIFF